MSEPLATVVVVPRERFSHVRRTLENVYANTRAPFRLVLVDGGSPFGPRRRAAALSRTLGFRLVRVDRYLTPNEARNVGWREVDTKYVVFLDNDTLVTPGWLEELVRCAEETDAWVVGPLCLEGPLEQQRIHAAGGVARVVERDGRRCFRDGHRLHHKHAPDVLPLLVREETEMVEFHCMLVRRDVFDTLGPLDEELLASLEHSNLCMRVRAAGGRVVCEPRSVMTYVAPPPLAWSDVPYFNLRWSEEWMRATTDRFVARWDLDPADPGLESSMAWARHHRRVLFRRTRKAYHALLGGGAGRLKRSILLPAERRLRRAVVGWTQQSRAGAPRPGVKEETGAHGGVRADEP